MEKKIAKATFLIILFLMPILMTEGGRAMPTKDEVYSPQSLLGLWGLPLLGWPLPPFKPPWFGGCCGGLLPFHGAPNAGAALNKANGQRTEVTKGDGNAIDQSP
ncbi:hypothetical protein CRYUN_Cryun23aG0061900 [Craigia yunnanensis]